METKNILIGRYILLDLLKKYVNQDRKFRLCSYYFQIKTVETIRHDNCDFDLQLGYVIIFLYTQHTGHV